MRNSATIGVFAMLASGLAGAPMVTGCGSGGAVNASIISGDQVSCGGYTITFDATTSGAQLAEAFPLHDPSSLGSLLFDFSVAPSTVGPIRYTIDGPILALYLGLNGSDFVPAHATSVGNGVGTVSEVATYNATNCTVTAASGVIDFCPPSAIGILPKMSVVVDVSKIGQGTGFAQLITAPEPATVFLLVPTLVAIALRRRGKTDRLSRA